MDIAKISIDQPHLYHEHNLALAQLTCKMATNDHHFFEQVVL